jgi:hypothetical protein
MELIKFNIHSVVDLITNSSTTIYTYQNSIHEAKELVQEVLNISGIKDKTPDDIFYYGVWCDDDQYLEKIDDVEDAPKVTAKWDTDEGKQQRKEQRKWLSDLQISIMKGETKYPDWMSEAETNGDYYDPDSYLCLIVKDEIYSGLADKIKALINSVDADGGRDG